MDDREREKGSQPVERRPITRVERRRRERREYFRWLLRTSLVLVAVGLSAFLAFVAVGMAAGLIEPIHFGGEGSPAAPATIAASESPDTDSSYLPGISTTVSPSPYEEHPNVPNAVVVSGSGATGTCRYRPNLPEPTPEKPLVVWYGGDSLSGMPGESFARQAAVTGVIDTVVDCQGGSRLAYDIPVDWTAEMQAGLAEHHARAVVFTIGTNDGGQQIDVGGTFVQFGSQAWAAEYRRRVSALIDLMVKSGVRRVYWLGAPVMSEAWRNHDLTWLNKVVKPEVLKHRRAVYIDAWKVLSDKRGRYVAEWRTYDGVHLSAAGADRLAAAVLGAVRRDWLR